MHRPVDIVVPFRLDGAKSRLSPALDPDERRKFALAMLRDVLASVRKFGEVTILTRSGSELTELMDDGSIEDAGQDAKVIPSDLELNDALNAMIEREALQGWPHDILIVMADLALLAKNDISGILGCPGDVVLCPGRGGGTNMILIRSPRFRTCYLGMSYVKHRDFARKAGLHLSIYESFRVGCDIDEPEDLAEVLLHGQGESRELLLELGFQLSEKARNSSGGAPIMRCAAWKDLKAR